MKEGREWGKELGEGLAGKASKLSSSDVNNSLVDNTVTTCQTKWTMYALRHTHYQI